MKIATWNINSVRARLDRLLAWLQKAQPDVLCLQETKVTDDKFPHEPIREAGYYATVYGQKTYNGVAILSRSEATQVWRGMGDGVQDPQARFLAAEVGGVQVVSMYVPNGQIVGTEPYAHKLQWLRRVRAFLDRRFTQATPLVLCGDLNIARDEKDVARPDVWAGSVLFHPTSRAAMDELLAWGLVDVFRQQHPEGGQYSWWDYQALSFPRNDGLRLEYVLATVPLAEHCTAAEIDREERKGVKPSDHAPVIACFRGPPRKEHGFPAGNVVLKEGTEATPAVPNASEDQGDDRCWEVWRQGDDGNPFLVRGGLTAVQAEDLVVMYESRGHKQLYWKSKTTSNR